MMGPWKTEHNKPVFNLYGVYCRYYMCNWYFILYFTLGLNIDVIQFSACIHRYGDFLARTLPGLYHSFLVILGFYSFVTITRPNILHSEMTRNRLTNQAHISWLRRPWADPIIRRKDVETRAFREKWQGVCDWHVVWLGGMSSATGEETQSLMSQLTGLAKYFSRLIHMFCQITPQFLWFSGVTAHKVLVCTHMCYYTIKKTICNI